MHRGKDRSSFPWFTSPKSATTQLVAKGSREPGVTTGSPIYVAQTLMLEPSLSISQGTH